MAYRGRAAELVVPREAAPRRSLGRHSRLLGGFGSPVTVRRFSGAIVAVIICSSHGRKLTPTQAAPGVVCGASTERLACWVARVRTPRAIFAQCRTFDSCCGPADTAAIILRIRSAHRSVAKLTVGPTKCVAAHCPLRHVSFRFFRKIPRFPQESAKHARRKRGICRSYSIRESIEKESTQ